MAERDAEAVASEEELGQKWDRCIADAILKTGTKSLCASERVRCKRSSG